MTSLATVRAKIVATMNAVPGIGVVHGYEAFVKTEAKLKALYVRDGKLHGWQVRRVGPTSEKPYSEGVNEVIFNWRMRGFMALEDDTETGFDDLVEDIRTAFRLDPTLGGVVTTTVFPNSAGVQLDESLPVVFAGVLCHAVTLTLATLVLVEAGTILTDPDLGTAMPATMNASGNGEPRRVTTVGAEP